MGVRMFPLRDAVIRVRPLLQRFGHLLEFSRRGGRWRGSPINPGHRKIPGIRFSRLGLCVRWGRSLSVGRWREWWPHVACLRLKWRKSIKINQLVEGEASCGASELATTGHGRKRTSTIPLQLFSEKEWPWSFRGRREGIGWADVMDRNCPGLTAIG